MVERVYLNCDQGTSLNRVAGEYPIYNIVRLFVKRFLELYREAVCIVFDDMPFLSVLSKSCLFGLPSSFRPTKIYETSNYLFTKSYQRGFLQQLPLRQTLMRHSEGEALGTMDVQSAPFLLSNTSQISTTLRRVPSSSDMRDNRDVRLVLKYTIFGKQPKVSRAFKIPGVGRNKRETSALHKMYTAPPPTHR